ncbi:hypothetical protein HBI24_209040 [Parastagonospora nodorum]|nr:hypothetical protein HBH53_226270 [Parastagonospora nodorum]KAH4181631.1 hypothetical protein HBH42_232140 [Parastagonospora nodorum]KAH4190169.1 hypothetical protein HBI95_218500 [Parastagonospora nodorum]KAH4952550.1 hypothetical protein HBI78_239100 [Parastagonospora nodorum]KAH5175124.1 hypothetical protein HBH77_202810 [Parastagonospora nodorum]
MSCRIGAFTADVANPTGPRSLILPIRHSTPLLDETVPTSPEERLSPQITLDQVNTPPTLAEQTPALDYVMTEHISKVPFVMVAPLAFAYRYVVAASRADRLATALRSLDMQDMFPTLYLLHDGGIRGLIDYDGPRYMALYAAVCSQGLRLWRGTVLLYSRVAWLHEPDVAEVHHAPVMAWQYVQLACFWVHDMYSWCVAGGGSALWQTLPLSGRVGCIGLAIWCMVNGVVEFVVVMMVVMETTELMSWWL